MLVASQAVLSPLPACERLKPSEATRDKDKYTTHARHLWTLIIYDYHTGGPCGSSRPLQRGRTRDQANTPPKQSRRPPLHYRHLTGRLVSFRMIFTPTGRKIAFVTNPPPSLRRSGRRDTSRNPSTHRGEFDPNDTDKMQSAVAVVIPPCSWPSTKKENCKFHSTRMPGSSSTSSTGKALPASISCVWKTLMA